MIDNLYQSPEVLKQEWAAADADGTARTTPAERAPALVRSCFCALICSSVISRASPFSMALLNWLVFEEVWTPLEALAAAQGALTAEQCDAMAQYLEHETARLDADELAILLAPAQAIDDFYLQLMSLISLAAPMSEIDQSLWLQMILDRAYAERRPWYYTRVIEGLSQHRIDAPEPIVQLVLARITALEPASDLILAVGRWARNLAPDKRSIMVDQIVPLTRRIADPTERLRTLHYLLFSDIGDLRDVIYRRFSPKQRRQPRLVLMHIGGCWP